MGINKVVYLKSYAVFKGLPNDEGIDFLKKFGVATHQYSGTLENVTHMI
jgi:dCMP deaminase